MIIRNKFEQAGGTTHAPDPLCTIRSNTMELLPEKTLQYLIHLFDKDETRHIHEVLTHSENVVVDNHLSRMHGNLWILKLDPEVYKKYDSVKGEISKQIQLKLQHLPNGRITGVKIEVDLDRFEIISNRYQIVQTPWQEINIDQDILLRQLRTANSSLEFQNIGNTSRTIMQKLANELFDPNIHIGPEGVDLSSGKFKNRLHTIIKTKFEEKQFNELEKYAESLISTAEKSVDLTNKLTHDINANRIMAELSAVSVLNVLAIMKIVRDW